MGHGKETPRQQMIGLMYLFLTAMLALNVSKDVLNSFILVSDSLEKTIANYKSKNEKVYADFNKANMENPTKVGPWLKLADEVKSETKKLYDGLEQDKVNLAKYAEGDDTPAVVDNKLVISKLSQKDNIDKGGEYFIGKGNGARLKKEIDAYRENLIRIAKGNPKLQETIKTTLDTDVHQKEGEEGHGGHGGEAATWESLTFEHIPLIADFVMLATLQTNVKNIETDVINYLYAQISAGDFKVNAMEPTVIPNSNYIMRGNEYRAEVFLAAYDSTKAPVIKVGKYKSTNGKYEMDGEFDVLKVEGGKGIYTVPTRALGEKKWGGLIEVSSPDGGIINYPFDVTYQVSEPNLVISPTKMNVFYYGIDNPVEISVPGIPSDKIRPVAGKGLRIRKGRKGYIVKPTKTSGKVNITVMAEIDGKQKSMGKKMFRIKTIPEPKAKIMGKSKGVISKTMLLNSPGVIAELENFVFDLKFKVTKFTITVTKGGYTSELTQKGNKFTSQQRNAIKNLKSGSKLIIENIEAKGPDGRTKVLSPIIFKVK